MGTGGRAPGGRTVSLVTLGCGRNETDSEELAARLEAGGWTVAGGRPGAPPDGGVDVVVVNTCGFIASAKQESVDALLAAHETGAQVVAVGCLAQRYGAELADALPEASAVLSFDDYAHVGDRLDEVVRGRAPTPQVPRDRRRRIPVVAVHEPAAPSDRSVRYVPGHGDDQPEPAVPVPATGPQWVRRRLGDGPVAQLKIASGCDRRCSFCAIPSFRGSYVSRRPGDIVDEARWLASQGVRELVLVSENTTSYGSDLRQPRALEELLPALAGIVDRLRLTYLQPAEMRPGLIDAIASTPGVAPYFDLSFQHASGPVLRRMRRRGDADRYLGLIERIRAVAPDAGIRSNVIVGFPGETEDDVAVLERFVEAAELDAMGVFGYSDEDGTEAAGFGDKVDAAVVAERVTRLSIAAETAASRRARRRIGTELVVLVTGDGTGCAAHQAPGVDGQVTLQGGPHPIGTLVRCVAVASAGIDLVATPLPRPASGRQPSPNVRS